VTRIVDTRAVPRRVRSEFINAMASTIVPVEIDFAGGDPHVRGTVTDLGVLRITAIASNATSVTRTPRLAGDDLAPSLMLGLQMTGSSLLVQDGREVVVRPGDLCLCRSTAPYTLVDPEGYRQHQVRMPLDRLALPHDVISKVTALRLSPGHPVGDLTAAYFHRLTSRPELFDDAGSDLVSQPSLELLRAVIGTHLDASVSTESLTATFQLRILEYARAHLGDPSLNAQQIASEHHISVRHLYNVLAGGGIVLGDWIRARRLEQCRDELSRASSRDVPIATVAHRWGFRDASNFGRLFRAEYGMSPRQWRDTGQRATAVGAQRAERS
jgi:AraC-like DNA-binding protein